MDSNRIMQADHPRAFYGIDWREPVNQWLAISLILLMSFWVVLYYAVHKADAVATALTAPYFTSVSRAHATISQATSAGAQQ